MHNTLLISDVHQDVPWLKRILEIEKDNFQEIIFLGDFFDTHAENFDIASICRFMLEVSEKYNCQFLWGNHDIAYYEALFSIIKHQNPKELWYYCGGYSNSKAKKIAALLPIEFFKSWKLCTFKHGYLLSHAGVMPQYFSVRPSLEESVEKFFNDCEDCLKNFRVEPQKLLAAGISRGGFATVGSPIWADLDGDFMDLLPFPQIFGHTTHEERFAKVGNSFCIDGFQSVYAILNEKELTIKSTTDTFYQVDCEKNQWFKQTEHKNFATFPNTALNNKF